MRGRAVLVLCTLALWRPARASSLPFNQGRSRSLAERDGYYRQVRAQCFEVFR